MPVPVHNEQLPRSEMRNVTFEEDEKEGDDGSSLVGSTIATAGSTVQDVADHFREKGLQRAAKRALISKSKTQAAALEMRLNEQQEKLDNIRRRLALSSRAQTGLELELWKLRSQRKESEKRMKRLGRETADMEASTAHLEEQWEQNVHNLYAPQRAHEEIFVRAIQMKIEKNQSAGNRRRAHTEYLRQKLREIEDAEAAMKEEQQRRTVRMKEVDPNEEKEDEDITGLALQIKATLRNRKVVRRSLEFVQDSYAKANEALTKWESSCLRR